MEGPFLDPAIPDGERTAYRCRIDAAVVATGELVVAHATDGERELYRTTLSADVGEAARYRGEVSFRRRAGTLFAERYAMRVHDARDQLVSSEEASFRGVKIAVLGGEPVAYPRDLVPLAACLMALRGLEFRAGVQRGLSAWLASTVHWPLEATVLKRESITLPDGEHDAWPVRIRASFEQVDGALDRLLDALLSAPVAHFAAQPPHRFLRLEFPLDTGRSAARAVIEAVLI